MKRRLWIVMLVLVALLVPTATALAGNGGNDGGKVVFGGDFVLKEGERLDGDLAVFGGDVTLEPDSLVNGDVLVMGGSVTAAGEINGDVVVFGGNARLQARAVVDGDVITLGGNISEAEGATVRGKTSQGFSFGFVPRVRMPRPPTVWWPWQSGANPVLGLFLRGLKALGTALVLALLAVLVVSLWPKPTGLVANTVWRSPAASFGVGLLTQLVVAGLVVLLIITICLSPLLVLATAVAWLFGWISLGWLVGRRLLAALKARNVASVWEAGIGVFLITLLGAVPCIGWLVWLVGGAFGLGAVVLTRFGSQRYNGAQPAPPPEPLGVLPAGPILPEEDEAPELPSVELPSPEEDEAPELPSVELPSPEEDEAPELPSVELPSPEDGEPAGALLSDPSLPEPPEVASVEEVEPD